MSELSLRISEIFTSVQGEGIWVGTPSVFVRVSGCNLRCVWCDTPYASWEPEGPVRPVADIVAEVRAAGVRHVVVTGGEPMLFEAVVPLCQTLADAGHVVTIETAGTVFREIACSLFSISPKMSNSTPHERASESWLMRHEATRLNRKPLSQLLETYPEHQLKFVVQPSTLDTDLAEIDALLAEISAPTPPERILLMAEGVSSEAQHLGQRALVDVCIERGWRLTPRLHIDLFGNTRGT